jgi:hypothetical protein
MTYNFLSIQRYSGGEVSVCNKKRENYVWFHAKQRRAAFLLWNGYISFGKMTGLLAAYGCRIWHSPQDVLSIQRGGVSIPNSFLERGRFC